MMAEWEPCNVVQERGTERGDMKEVTAELAAALRSRWSSAARLSEGNT